MEHASAGPAVDPAASRGHQYPTRDGGSVFIEVKGRISGAEDVTATLNEVLLGKTVPAAHRLALVEVGSDELSLSVFDSVDRGT